jgi:hypothetical protein
VNVQSIWAGHEYAYSHYKGNKSFPMHAKRGTAKRVEKVRDFGSERAKAYVIFDVNGEEVKVRARDVIDFWVDYERERDHIVKEREEAQERARIEREKFQREREERYERERIEREQKERAAAARVERLVDALVAKTGIPRDIVTSVGALSVQLDRTTLELWLSVQNGDSNKQPQNEQPQSHDWYSERQGN